MSRIKSGKVTRRKHKRLLKKTKGFWGQRKNVFKRAKQTLLRSMAFAFKSRRLKKRDMRALFITRIGAASRQNGISYQRFMYGLQKASVELNRKMLSQLAIFEPKIFSLLVDLSKD